MNDSSRLSFARCRHLPSRGGAAAFIALALFIHPFDLAGQPDLPPHRMHVFETRGALFHSNQSRKKEQR